MSILGFEIGNGWILSIFVLVVSYFPMLFGGQASKRLVNFSFSSTRGKVFSVIMSVFFLFWILYPLFLQIQFNRTTFWVGLVLLAVGAVCSIISYINYFTSPLDQAIEKGMYRISRNPIYVSMALMVIGVAVMLRTPLIGLALVANIILQHFIILEEEEFCEDKYGDSYREFKMRVPRYLILRDRVKR